MNVGWVEFQDFYCFYFGISHMKPSVRILEIYESPLINVASCKFEDLEGMILKSSNVSDSVASRLSLVFLELPVLALFPPIV
jgi:hypothetical protein